MRRKIFFILVLFILLFLSFRVIFAAGCDTVSGCGGTAGCTGTIWGCCKSCQAWEKPYTNCKTGWGDVCKCNCDGGCAKAFCSGKNSDYYTGGCRSNGLPYCVEAKSPILSANPTSINSTSGNYTYSITLTNSDKYYCYDSSGGETSCSAINDSSNSDRFENFSFSVTTSNPNLKVHFSSGTSGGLLPGSTYTTYLYVDSHPSSPGTYYIYVTATSDKGGKTSSTLELNYIVSSPGPPPSCIRQAPSVDPSPISLSSYPEEEGKVVFTVKNNDPSSCSDASIGGNLENFPSGWKGCFSHTSDLSNCNCTLETRPTFNTLPISPGDRRDICLKIKPPQGVSNGNYNFSLKTYNNWGYSTYIYTQITYTVNSSPTPIVDLKANGSNGPLTINTNTSLTLVWTVSNANSCTLSSSPPVSGVGSSYPGGGQEFINSLAEGNYTFTVTCTGAGGTDSDSVQVTVNLSPPVCGNGICESGECFSGCTQDCSVADCCGNGTCDSTIGENSNNCSNDCGPVCGNGIVEPGEDCDGSTNGKTCSDFGFTGGILRCTNCKFDTSQCINVHSGRGECNTSADCHGGKECYCDPDPNDNIADGWCYESGSVVFCPPGTDKTLNDILREVLNYIFLIAIVLTPLMIIIAALYFIFSGGDPQKIAKAKRIFFYAIVGLVVALLAKAIIGIIKMMFGG